MKHYTRLGFAGLLTVIAVFVASCGGAGDSSGNGSSGSNSGSNEMQGMDHGNKKDGGSEGGSEKGMSGMDMEEGSDGDMSEMLMKNGEYSDERFVDAMVPHHEGAVEMAEVGIENADHAEIKTLSENIVSTQKAEITELNSIKEEEFGGSDSSMSMDMDDMKSMGMMMDPQQLAEADPFDKAFIDNMIPHHQSAIEMAEVARGKTKNPRIKTLAGEIIDGQTSELESMKQWREEWYPEG